MRKKYELPESEPQMVSETNLSYEYSADIPVMPTGGDTGLGLTTAQLHRIIELSDNAIANGDVFTHDEVKKRLSGYVYGSSVTSFGIIN